jgi:prepilin-type N-terminal cleavage/methylation domain-containing protein
MGSLDIRQGTTMVEIESTGKTLRSDRSEAGFTLIETMIAAAILTVGLVAIVGVAAYVSRTNATSNILNVLATTAQDQADKMRNLTWNVVSSDPKLAVGGNLDYNLADDTHRSQVTNTPAGTLNISWKVANGPGTTGDMRTITIKAVQVNPPSRLAQGVTITTIVAQN